MLCPGSSKVLVFMASTLRAALHDRKPSRLESARAARRIGSFQMGSLSGYANAMSFDRATLVAAIAVSAWATHADGQVDGMPRLPSLNACARRSG